MTSATTPWTLLIDAAVKREPFAFDKPYIVLGSKIAGFTFGSTKARRSSVATTGSIKNRPAPLLH